MPPLYANNNNIYSILVSNISLFLPPRRFLPFLNRSHSSSSPPFFSSEDMLEWVHVIIILVVCFLVIATLFAVISWRCCCSKKREEIIVSTANMRTESLQAGIIRLHQEGLVDSGSKRPAGTYYMFQRGVSGKPLFSWSQHPSLITEAVENGWSRFAFTGYMSSPSTKSRLLGGLCSVGDHHGEEPELSWEISQGSADFMQKIRLNSGFKKVLNLGNHSMAAASVIRTALPLPGPPLDNSSFPQEAYFEITIFYCPSRCDSNELESSVGKKKVKEGEKTKLIPDSSHSHSHAKPNSESFVHRNNKITKEELKLVVVGKDDQFGKGEGVMLSIGLTAGGSVPLKLPGSYPGSIGFSSNGSVYLDGMKLVFESEKAEWGRTDKVIGCGFDPRQKKVFFTVDSELIHVVHCKAEEFGSPLYPTLAANADVLVLVNLGQSVFKYAPANAQRTPNPCFVGPLGNSPAAALGYDDSKELFSMGRIDSQWLNRTTTRGSQSTNPPTSTNPALDFDEESEADLFEIVLDSCGRSPNVVS